MGSTRKRSKLLKEKALLDESVRDDGTKQNPPWKILLMLVFLGILSFLLVKHSFDDTTNTDKKREIPNPEVPIPPSQSILYSFKHAAVSSDSQQCSEIGSNVLSLNGNVFDVAISTLICNSMTQLQSMGILGGFLLTVFLKSEQKSIVVDAQMVSPINFNLKQITNFTQVKEGGLSIAVPGFLKGIWEIHKKYSSLTWNKLIEPTMTLCNKGIILTKHLHDSLNMHAKLTKDPYFRELFVDKITKKFKRIGSKIVMTKHCQFLEALSLHTNPDIYHGTIGSLIAADLIDAGSLITLEDLRSYKVKFSEPIKTKINNHIILTPNTAATIIPLILNVIKEFKLDETSLDEDLNLNTTILNYHRIVETFKHAFAKRSELGDPEFVVNVNNVVTEMLTPEFAHQIRNAVDDNNSFSNIKHYTKQYVTPENHGTSHISIISSTGDAVSITSSINYYFGNGMSGKRTGLIFNNGMDDFSYPGRKLNYFNLEETLTNYPEPMKRAISSMAPIVILDEKTNEVRMVIGGAGGSKIITAISMALIRYLWCGQSLKEIIDAPRLHHQLTPNVIEYEFGFTKSVIDGLSYKNHKLKRFRNRGSILNALMIQNQNIHAISDYRKDHSGVNGF